MNNFKNNKNQDKFKVMQLAVDDNGIYWTCNNASSMDFDTDDVSLENNWYQNLIDFSQGKFIDDYLNDEDFVFFKTIYDARTTNFWKYIDIPWKVSNWVRRIELEEFNGGKMEPEKKEIFQILSVVWFGNEFLAFWHKFFPIHPNQWTVKNIVDRAKVKFHISDTLPWTKKKNTLYFVTET